MKTRLLLLVTAAALTFLLSACSGKTVPMSASNARGLCLSSIGDPEDRCIDSHAVCDQYAQVIGAKYASQAECRKACNDLRISLTSSTPGIGCGYISGKGQTACITYCESNY